jgi:Bacterial Ig-like domain (group 2)
MARITIKEVKTSLGISETYDIVNAIRNSNPTFANYVPLAGAENVAQVGAGIMINQTIQNDFITNLVDRIGLVVVKSTLLSNPLKKFKKGAMPFGRTIEEIFTDITKAKKYDPYDAENTVFKRNIPNVKSLFHERNRQDFYDSTISDEQLKTAFTSWGNFESFTASIINSIYNSAEVDEYEYMKLLVDNYYSKGHFTVVPVTAPTTETATREFVKKLRATAKKMTLPTGSRDFNALAVRTRTEMDDLHLIIDADLEAQMDVEVLARAFNMNHTDFLGHVTVIDGFSSSGLEAVLIDKDWFMVYDNLTKMETIRNPKGLYWTYFFHIWQTLSVSRFSNAVAFVSGTVPAVTQVIVDPTIASVKAGGTFEFNAYVRATDGQDHPVVWSVVASNASTTKQAGTTINSDGVLTVDPTQTGELIVRATVAGAGVDTDGAGADTADVIGESIVTIIL